MATSVALIDLVKRHLHITWSDDDTDSNLISWVLNVTSLFLVRSRTCIWLTWNTPTIIAWNSSMKPTGLRSYRSGTIMKLRERPMIQGRLNPRFSNYNHGVLYISRSKTKNTDFGAPTNAKKMSEVEKLQKLDFQIMSKRERDFEFAQASDHSLDLKVRTRFHSSASTDRQVLIGRTLYDIFQVDGNEFSGEMYLYLEKVRELADE